MKQLLIEWNKFLLTERLDYETLVITRKVMSYIRRSIETIQKNRSRSDEVTVLTADGFPFIAGRLPEKFAGIIVRVVFKNNATDVSTSGSAQSAIDIPEESSGSVMKLTVHIDNNLRNKSIKELYSIIGVDMQANVKGTIRHELEHVYQPFKEGDYFPSSEAYKYYISDAETEAYIVQLVRQAKSAKLPVQRYLNYMFKIIRRDLEEEHKKKSRLKQFFSKSVDRELNDIKKKWNGYLKKRYPRTMVK